jgi:hypothetical protein
MSDAGSLAISMRPRVAAGSVHLIGIDSIWIEWCHSICKKWFTQFALNVPFNLQSMVPLSLH